jgi:hypothetical protein
MLGSNSEILMTQVIPGSVVLQSKILFLKFQMVKKTSKEWNLENDWLTNSFF